MTNKSKKTMSIIIAILAIVLVVEIIYFGIKMYNNRKDSTFYTIVSSAILDNADNYIGVGFSDYRHSKFNEFEFSF